MKRPTLDKVLLESKSFTRFTVIFFKAVMISESKHRRSVFPKQRRFPFTRRRSFPTAEFSQIVK